MHNNNTSCFFHMFCNFLYQCAFQSANGLLNVIVTNTPCMNQYLLQVELLIYKKVVLCEVTFYLTLSWLNSIQLTSKTQVQRLC